MYTVEIQVRNRIVVDGVEISHADITIHQEISSLQTISDVLQSAQWDTNQKSRSGFERWVDAKSPPAPEPTPEPEKECLA